MITWKQQYLDFRIKYYRDIEFLQRKLDEALETHKQLEEYIHQLHRETISLIGELKQLKETPENETPDHDRPRSRVLVHIPYCGDVCWQPKDD